MKKNKIIITSVLLCLLCNFNHTVAFSQNLVPNAGFEDETGCPAQINEVDLANGWSGWGGTPDYFHSCSNLSAPLYGVPNNTRGFQPARSGDAYIGLFTFANFSTNMREFVGRELIQPLQPGTTYYVSLWVNHAEQSLVQFATNNIGVRFSTTPFSQANPDSVNNQPAVFSSSVITDNINWVVVKGSFVADSAYTHIGIGNYISDSLTTIQNIGGPNTVYAYYLIDDICVATDSSYCFPEPNSISEHTPFLLSVFPNPAQNLVTIKLDHSAKSSEKLKYRIYDLHGREIFTGEMIFGAKTTIDTSSWPAGIYHLWYADDAFSGSKKLAIVK